MLRILCRHLRNTVACLPALIAVVALAAFASPAAAVTPSVTYAYSGGATTTMVGDTVAESLSGTASSCQGAGCLTAPASGTVSIAVQWPPNPCRKSAKTLSGNLTAAWSDATTSTATVSGRVRDHSTSLTLSGTVASGTFAGRSVTVPVTLSYPPSPCRTDVGTFSGSLAFG